MEDDICKSAQKRGRMGDGNGIEEKLLVCLVVQLREIKRGSLFY